MAATATTTTTTEPLAAASLFTREGSRFPHIASTEERVIPVRFCPTTKEQIDLCYQTYGSPADPAVMVVCGLNSHLGMYAPEFLRQLAAKGYYVIIFDNRDAGRSTKLDHKGSPMMLLNILPEWMLLGYNAPTYHLEDMAADAWALLDKLDISRAHVLGTSMGGMIVQIMALTHPERTLSLSSLMSSTGAKDAAQAALSIKLHMLTAPKSQEVEDLVEFRTWFATKVLLPEAHAPEDVDFFRHTARFQAQRHRYRSGVTRQTTAIARAKCREERLKQLTSVPALVVHGDADRLVPYENGPRTARALPRSRVLSLPGVGHVITPRVWERIVEHFHAMVLDPPTRSAEGLSPS